MPRTQHTPEEIARIAEGIYARDIRPKVMPRDKGKFLVLDIDSAAYEIDADDVQATERLLNRVPNGEYFGLRIGYTTSYAFAGGMEEEEG